MREFVFVSLAAFEKRRWFCLFKTSLAESNRGGPDSMDDCGALRWHLHVSLVAAEEDRERNQYSAIDL